MVQGKYVVIEGNDGTGKSTQVELLSAYLNNAGIETFVTHEPAGSPIADAIRTVIKNGDLERDAETNLLLFTAARHDIWQTAKKALTEGKWVISARNYISTEVYQGFGEGLAIDRIHAITREFTDDTYMKPDFTFVLHLTDDEREKRIAERGVLESKDTFESRGEDFQATLNDGYKKLAERYGFPLVDANRSIEEIQTEIRSLIDDDIAQSTGS